MAKAMEILRRYLSALIGADVDAMAQCFGAGARVGGITDMPIASACRIRLSNKAGPLRRIAKRRLGQRRPADIAQANE